jgi:hypothetical protein
MAVYLSAPAGPVHGGGSELAVPTPFLDGPASHYLRARLPYPLKETDP